MNFRVPASTADIEAMSDVRGGMLHVSNKYKVTTMSSNSYPTIPLELGFEGFYPSIPLGLGFEDFYPSTPLGLGFEGCVFFKPVQLSSIKCSSGKLHLKAKLMSK